VPTVPPPPIEGGAAIREQPGYIGVRTSPGWRRLPSGNIAVRSVLHGHRIPVLRSASRLGFHQPCSGRLAGQFIGHRVVETTRMLRTGALVEAPTQHAAELIRRGHWITPSFMVPKKNTTKKRMVYNQKRSNERCRKRKIKLEHLREVQHVARPGCRVFTADVGAKCLGGKDGYHAVQIDPRDQHMLTSDQGLAVHLASLGPPDRQAILEQAGVDIAGMTAAEISEYWAPVPQFVMCAALPFGYCNSVWLFTLVMREAARLMRERGVRCLVYLDDWAFFPDTNEQAVEWQQIATEVWDSLGLMKQPGKGTVQADGSWDVVQELTHLGVGLSFKQNVFFVPEDVTKRIKTEGKRILSSANRHQGKVGCLWLAQFAGLVMSTHTAVRQARFKTRPLFDDLVRARAYQSSFKNWCRLSRESKRMIEWWMQLSCAPELGRRVWNPAVNLPWTCDACTTAGKGWGATLPSVPLTGSPQQSLGLPCAGIWTAAERELSITALELKAVRRALEVYSAWPVSGQWSVRGQGQPGQPVGATRSLIRGRSLHLWEDNAAVVFILNNYATASVSMREDLEGIMGILELEDAWMRAAYVRSADNPSDYFSRMPSKAEWVLSQETADVCMQRFQPCTVDRFADLQTARLPRFNSPYPCRGCEWVDAFSTSWAGECSWINPPWKLIPQIVTRLHDEPAAAAVLLLPRWPSRPWWPALMSIAAEVVNMPVDPAHVSMTGLAAQMGVVPEVTKRAGRADNMVLVYVRARAEP
jgi:hypothetical protein